VEHCGRLEGNESFARAETPKGTVEPGPGFRDAALVCVVR
jgi:hypothetical protein